MKTSAPEDVQAIPPAADALAGRRVLVTGATGYIGLPLCRRLLQLDARVHAVARSLPPGDASDRIAWARLDLTELDELRAYYEELRPEIIYHLAGHAKGARDVDLVLPTFHSNLTSTVNLFTVAVEQGCERIVLPGSLEEPEGDGREAVPSSPYAAAKWAASGYARMFRALYDLPVVTARVFMVYGPGRQSGKKLIPYVIRSLLRDESPRLSSGRRAIDWIYIEDVVDGLVRLGTRPGLEGERIDIGSGELLTIRDLVGRIADMIDGSARPLFGELSERPHEQVRAADVEETRRRLGWSPTTPLEEGLRKTVAWYSRRTENGAK